MKPTADDIEAESAALRLQVATAGADLRRHIDPSVIVDQAKASFKSRTEGAPDFLKRNASPIGLLILGGACGAGVTGLFSRARQSRRPREWRAAAPEFDGAIPGSYCGPSSLKAQAKAMALSVFGVGLGYLIGLFVPVTDSEERLLGGPRDVLRAWLDKFLEAHVEGMKSTAANLFGVSRLSAAAIVGLALVADAVVTPSSPTKPHTP